VRQVATQAGICIKPPAPSSMSLFIQSLLVQLGGTEFARRALKDHGEHGLLTLSNGVVLTLSMSTNDEYLVFSSSPAQVVEDSEASPSLGGHDARLVWETQDESPHEAGERLLIDARHRLLVWQRCVARRALDLQTFKREIEHCAERHERWRMRPVD
jgi:hypothetical protein